MLNIMTDKKNKVQIIGIGNILRNDDGVGPYIINELKKKKLPDNVELINVEIATLDILHLIKKENDVIVIDSMTSSTKVGKIYTLKLEDLPDLNTPFNLHEMDLKTLFLTAKEIGILPKNVRFYAIEVKDVNFEGRLSDEVKAAAEELVKILTEELTKNNNKI